MSFLSLWLIQALIISQGMESVRKFQDFCGPAIWLVMIALAIWVLAKAGWTISLTSTPHPVSVGEQWRQCPAVHRVLEPLARHDRAGLLDQRLEHRELPRRELHLGAVEQRRALHGSTLSAP